eukprot:751696-Hanusia_phi.AAC.3
MEFVPTSSRGKATTLLTIFATFGSLTASGLAWALMERAGWQTFLILCSSPGIIIAFFRSQMLESPYFLAETGRDEESLQVLQEVARYNGYNQMLLEEGSSIKKSEKIPLRVVLKSLSAPHVRNRLVATSCLWFALSYGFYGFNVWGPSYFDARGFKPQVTLPCPRPLDLLDLTLLVVLRLCGRTPIKLSSPPWRVRSPGLSLPPSSSNAGAAGPSSSSSPLGASARCAS